MAPKFELPKIELPKIELPRIELPRIPRVSLETSASGEVDPEEAWDRYLRPARWPQWSPQITGVDCRRRRIARGVTGTVHGWFGSAADFEVTAVDQARRTWSWHVQSGPIGLDLDHGVQPYGSGARVWVRVSGPAPVVLTYLPLAWLGLRNLVNP